ncbi:MAG: response regulator [candidate division Zixibacteria bacterium]|nr:response regulator [candidate division Zixibacteria bacterium]
MKVMILEDEAVALKLVEKIVTQNGYEAIGFTSASRAIEWLQAGNLVNVVISDVMLPGIDGFQFVKFMKSKKRLAKIPVILCTSLSDKAAVVKGITVGASDYITKPVNAAMLIQKIETAIQSAPGAVMIVDGEPIIRDVLDETLSREGYFTIMAESGEEAVEQLKKNKVSVILADANMPGMSGIDLLKRVKKEHSDIGVLIMSGHQNNVDEKEIKEAGADGFITKPLHNVDILARVGTFFK